MKNGEIILCNNIKLDKNYENVLSYNESSMVNLCRQHAIYTGTKYTMMDPSTNEIDIRCPYATCIYSNYIAFNNKNVGNKWYFAFVTDIIYVNPEVTKIRYQVDVFSTWYQRFNLNQAFIEREHVDDDTVGKNIIKEGLETGDFVVNSQEIFDEYATEYLVVVGSSKIPKEMGSTVAAWEGSKVYNGVFSGLYYTTFETPDDATKFLVVMDGQGIGDAVYDVFLIPKSLHSSKTIVWTPITCTATITIGSTTYNWNITFSYNRIPYSQKETYIKRGHTISINSTLNGYTPKNNKLFTGEFNYLYISNNGGSDIKYNYEDFYNNTPTFNVVGAITPGCSIKLIPQNYLLYNQVPSEENIFNPYGLNGAKYPVCSWASDSYTNWIVEQGHNITWQHIGDATTEALNIGLLATGNPMALMSLAGNTLGLIQSDMALQDKYNYTPPQSRGNVNTGDVNFATGQNTFIAYKMSVRYDQAKRIDDFFSRFGYKVNEVKTPNLNSRSKFNFIKIGGMDELVTGSIPASDLEAINGIFRKGVTIFHNYNDIGNYLVDNPIVTP